MKIFGYKINLPLALVICSFCYYILFFLPIFQLAAQSEENIFNISCFNILLRTKFNIVLNSGTQTIAFPHYAHILISATLIFNTLAIILAINKHYKLAASFFSAITICSISTLPAINDLKKNLINMQISSNRIFITLNWSFFILILLNLTCITLSLLLVNLEHLAKTVFLFFSTFTVLIIISIAAYMLTSGLPAMTKIGIFNFLFKSKWHPATNEFGILNLIKASIFSTIGAVLLATPVGILTAVFMSELCDKKLLFFLKPLVELFAGIPSVVFGFFAMSVIVPAIKIIFSGFYTNDGSPVVGDSMLAVILVLTLMILPTIINTSFSALKSVPQKLKEASLSLGANKIETIFKVCIPTAKTTIISGVTLAIGRAIGETMAVIMVAGNIAKPPELLGTVRLLTTGIALDLGYASGLLKSALFAIGIVLLILITIINVSFNLLCKKGAFAIGK